MICADCRLPIIFVGTKWLSNPKKQGSWKCGHDPDFPVKSHNPTMPEGEKLEWT